MSNLSGNRVFLLIYVLPNIYALIERSEDAFAYFRAWLGLSPYEKALPL
jgi:hypothetical protein